jgi:vacuolar-type H+-ATPase subunit I/STV1
MAIARIKKLELIGLQKDKDQILTLLQRLGIVELISIEDVKVGLAPSAVKSGINLLEIEEAIDYLKSF